MFSAKVREAVGSPPSREMVLPGLQENFRAGIVPSGINISLKQDRGNLEQSCDFSKVMISLVLGTLLTSYPCE